MEPSVKGSVVKVAVDELRALVEKGRLLEDKLRDRLEPDFADVVREEPINIAAWYPASLYDALLHIFVDEIHVGEIERLAEGGRHAARKLSDAGFYGQLERRPHSPCHQPFEGHLQLHDVGARAFRGHGFRDRDHRRRGLSRHLHVSQRGLHRGRHVARHREGLVRHV